MKKQSVTIKDIAKRLDISPSTVSRALKDHFEISEETKEAVRKVAKELNYQPNSVALSLRNSKSNTIGVVVPEIVHFFFSTVISGIEDVAHRRGYNVIITQSNESYEREVMNIQTLFNNRVDGILISISLETFDFTHLDAVEERGLPVVFFDRTSDLDKHHSVIVDDFNGGYQATEHLIRQGYQRIAHLTGPTSLLITKERLRGYRKALEDAGISYDEELVMYDQSLNPTTAFDASHQLIQSKNPDAIFTSNDMAAMGAIKAAQKCGKNVPQDIGIVGFSNWQFTQYTNPSITTIEQPGFEMGQKSTEMLLKQIEADELEDQVETVMLATRLISRESTLKV